MKVVGDKEIGECLSQSTARSEDNALPESLPHDERIEAGEVKKSPPKTDPYFLI